MTRFSCWPCLFSDCQWPMFVAFAGEKSENSVAVNSFDCHMITTAEQQNLAIQYTQLKWAFSYYNSRGRITSRFSSNLPISLPPAKCLIRRHWFSLGRSLSLQCIEELTTWNPLLVHNSLYFQVLLASNMINPTFAHTSWRISSVFKSHKSPEKQFNHAWPDL